MNTRELIMEKALVLFNRDGVMQTSTRDIADACGISQGNLTYHFRQKNDLIAALFFSLKDKSDQIISGISENGFDMKNFINSIHEQFSVMYEYRFLFLDFLNILREVKTLKKEYAVLNQKRRLQFHEFLDLMNEGGYLNCRLSPEIKDSLYRMYSIYFNFWLTDAEILESGRKDKIIREYVNSAMLLLRPYLNDRANAVFFRP